MYVLFATLQSKSYWNSTKISQSEWDILFTNWYRAFFILTTGLVISLSNILANIMQKNNVYCIPVGAPVIKREGLKSHEHCLTPSHVCACPKTRTWNSNVIHRGLFVFSERWLCVLLILVELLTITVYIFFSWFSS